MLDVLRLSLFRATTEQNDNCLTIPAEVNAKPGAVVYLVFKYAAHALYIGKIAQCNPGDANRYLCRDRLVELVEPDPKRASVAPVEILSNLEHFMMETQMLPSEARESSTTIVA